MFITLTLFLRPGLCFGKVTARPAWAFSAFPGNHAGVRCACCLWAPCLESVVLRVTWRSCLQWEQDGFPVQINLGQGMALFSVELARQNKENKKRQTQYMKERGNLLKARTKIAGILSVFKNKISVRVRGKSIFRAWKTTWLSWLYICKILPGSS